MIDGRGNSERRAADSRTADDGFVEDILGRQGRIAQRLSTYESRPQQLQMAHAIEAAIAGGEHLIVEAGTGVGKSFAYLVPAIAEATREQRKAGKNKRVVISTHTISLQEQLVQKDVPFLNAVLPFEFSAVLVKGRSNYISLRRLEGASVRQQSMFDDGAVAQFRRVQQWAKSTRDGSRADLGFRPLPQIWDEIQSEHGNCLGRKCPKFDQCHYYAARRRMQNADLLIVNHALFFADLALRRVGVNLLPDYDAVVFDEAHTLEEVAGEHLGLSVSSGQITYLLNRLYNERQRKGLLLSHALENEQRHVLRLRHLSGAFFDSVAAWRERGENATGRARRPIGVDNSLSPELKTLAGSIREFAKSLDRPEDRIELDSAADRLSQTADTLSSWLEQKQEDSVYWVERQGRQNRNVVLSSAPIDIAPVLRDELFAKVDSVILTSATLAIGQQDLRFFRKRIGLTKARELILGSPFDHERQVRLVCPKGMPDPARQSQEFETVVARAIRHYVGESRGRAFVLFTSYRSLRQAADRLTGWFAEQNLELLCQGGDLSRSQMIDRFKKDDGCVLFGTTSFWQGVDVPGDALQHVIITRLPFSVPDHPLLEARMERIRENGGNPFMEYQVPEAIIKLKQGFGRLIRSRTDTGQVIILDPRLHTKPFGRLFLESLPVRTVHDR